MAASFTKSRPKRFKIAELRDQGMTLQEAENIVLAGDSNKTRTVKQWQAGGAYPYGQVDGPDSQTQITFAPDEQTTHTAPIQQDRHIAGSQGARKQVQTAITPGINWNDKALNDKLKVLILDVLKEQGILQTAITPDPRQAPKLWRTMNNVSPISLRLQSELIKRSRQALKAKYGNMSLNRYVELCLFDLIGRPVDLTLPDE